MKVFDLLVVLLLTFFIFWLNPSSYLKPVKLAALESSYQNSQYVKPNSYTYFIDDPEVYTVAGWHYINGEDPSKINFEHQPLAKYLIGLSVLIFNNQNILQLVTAFICLYLTLVLSTLALPKSLLRFVPACLLVLDPLFVEQGSHAYLDIYQLAATLLLFLLVLKNRFFVAAVTLGLVMLTNTVWSGILTGGTVFLYLLLKDRKHVFLALKALPLTFLTYLLGYVVFFLTNSPLNFISLHLSQFRFYLSYVPDYPKGEIFRVIFQGIWRKWFGDFGFMPAKPWSLSWPLALMLSFVPLGLKKSSNLVILFTLWTVVWLLFLSSKLVFPRYMLAVLPFIYILATLGVNYIIVGAYDNWHKRQRSKH